MKLRLHAAITSDPLGDRTLDLVGTRVTLSLNWTEVKTLTRAGFLKTYLTSASRSKNISEVSVPLLHLANESF